MSGETDLNIILKTMTPVLQAGEYVFCHVPDNYSLDLAEVISVFKEKEGLTIILSREVADRIPLEYAYVAAWITLNVHSALESIGLTAAFSNALGAAGISCNVVAAYFHDHIFVDIKNAEKAMEVLRGIAK
jgi:hypothetical protein